MKIIAVKYALPSLTLDNEEVINRLKQASRDRLDECALAHAEAEIRQYFASAGTKVRYFLGENENAQDILESAINDALGAASVSVNDIDFIIYAGVSRGWLEPSMACAVQDVISAKRAVCFDVSEACASWMRGMHVADFYFKGGAFQLGLIVNCECAFAHMAPWANGIESLEELKWCVAALTVGEAATATLISADNTAKLYFAARSFGAHRDLCMIPLGNASSHSRTVRSRPKSKNTFYSDPELISTTLRYLVEQYKSDPLLCKAEHDIYFSHNASERVGQAFRRQAGISDKRWYSTHARFGNTVAASIPMGMSCAIEEGILHRGDRVMAIVGSAGISTGFMSFVY